MMKSVGLKLVLGLSAVAFGIGLAGSPAYALDLTPSDAFNIPGATGTGPCDADCVEAYVNPFLDPDVTNLTLQYKSEVANPPDPNGVGVDSGPYAGEYNTTFSNTATDPSDALIDYVGTSAINCVTQVCILEVKDGNQTPGRYFIDITGWNGTDDLNLQGFWPSNGAISHVSIYSGGSVVPEPATLMLLGAGLAGLGIWRRKVLKG